MCTDYISILPPFWLQKNHQGGLHHTQNPKIQYMIKQFKNTCATKHNAIKNYYNSNKTQANQLRAKK